MKTATFDSLKLDSRNILSPVTIAWSHYGVRPEKARAIIVLLHGISSSPQALSCGGQPSFCDRGWFSGWIGPGQIFDTRHDCILAPNALGSCHGSSGPASCASPDSFPEITIGDTVRLYKPWLKSLGIDRVTLALGYSYGGYQAFEWALRPPLPTRTIVVLASAPRGRGMQSDVYRMRELARALDRGGCEAQRQWLQLRVATLQRYGYAEYLADIGCARIDERLATEATHWASQFSAWSMASLRKAAMDFNVEAGIRAGNIESSLFWLNCTSDALFPCDFAGLGPNAKIATHCVDGKYGHMSPVLESELWTSRLKSHSGLFRHA